MLAIVATAAVARFWGLGFGLPFGYARPDETYIIDVVLPLLQGRTPPPNYEYPWLYMWFTGLGYIGYYLVGAALGTFQSFAEMPASWKTDYAPFFLINRAISATAGTLTVVLVFRIARRLWDDRTGLVAAACLALAYLHARDSHFGTTDATMTALVVWSVLLILDAHERGGWHRFALAGLTGGLAVATKYNAVFAAVPFALSLAAFATSPGRDRIREAGRRVVAYAVLFGLGMTVGLPFVLMDPGGFVLKIQMLLASTAAGQSHQELGPGWLTHLQYSLRYGLGAAMLAAGIAGVAVVAVRDGVRGWLVLGFPLTYFAVMGAAANQYFRYMMPVVPFLALTAAAAVRAASAWAGARTAPPRRARVSSALAAACTVALVAEPGLRIWRFDRALAATDNRVLAADWIAANVAPGSSLLVSGSHYGHPWLPASREYRVWSWHQGERRYEPRGGPDDAGPEWILRQESPLSRDRPEIAELLKAGYVVAWRFPAMTNGRGVRTFDRMDAFYLPFAGFDGVIRPGPSFTLFRRADVVPGPPAGAAAR